MTATSVSRAPPPTSYKATTASMTTDRTQPPINWSFSISQNLGWKSGRSSRSEQLTGLYCAGETLQIHNMWCHGCTCDSVDWPEFSAMHWYFWLEALDAGLGCGNVAQALRFELL